MSNATTTATAPAISTLEGAGNAVMQIFKNAEFGNLRGAEINGEPWFVLKDICAMFGENNYRRVAARLEDYEKGVSQMDTPGGKQSMIIVNEGGVYSALFAMQPQKARGVTEEYIAKRTEQLRKFKHWVTSEVLPTIRKHGAYMTPQAVEQVLQDPDFIIRLATNLKDEQQKRKEAEGQVLQLTAKVTALKPKADYCDLILASDTAVTITQIAADYNMSAKAMNLKLHDLGIQWKVNGQWILYTEFMDKGYTRSSTIHLYQSDGRERTKMNTLWTQKGRLFLYDKLKAAGVLPLMEQ